MDIERLLDIFDRPTDRVEYLTLLKDMTVSELLYTADRLERLSLDIRRLLKAVDDMLVREES